MRPYKAVLRRVMSDSSEERVHYVFNTIMMVLVLASIVELVLESDPNLTESQFQFYLRVEHFFNMIFLVEYLLRWWICSDFYDNFIAIYTQFKRRTYHVHPAIIVWRAFVYAMRPKISWMTKPMSIIDLLAILPIFWALRVLRVLRVLWLLKLFRYSRRLSFFSSIFRDHSYELISIVGVSLILFSAAAVAFYVVEHGSNERVESIWGALYWSVITIATVGYGDITPITPAGRFIAVLGVLVGMWVPILITSVIVSALSERMVKLKEYRMERQIERLRDHFIVCGLDDLGQAVCRSLKMAGVPFVCIDNRQERVDDALRDGWVATRADVTEERSWNRLGLQKARGVISAIADESVNVYIILMVRERRPDCFIIVCASSHASEKRLMRVGANRVVSPFQLGGMQMVNMALRPTTVQFIDLAMKRDHLSLDMEELEIPVHSIFANLCLRDSDIRRQFDIIVVGIVPESRESHDMIFNPNADTMLRAGDVLICLGHPDDLERLRQALNDTDPSFAALGQES
ncbi:MAG: NAD-binding protein [Magnetococcales bacterium]|nr:NAD-binding protein [Magnetococcales bacterium]